jgi:hypothetical protein
VNSLIFRFGLFFVVMCIVGVGYLRSRPKPGLNAVVSLLGAALFFGGILNFVVYWHLSVYLGGNALSGRVENGKYYLASHGRRTEVSRAMWEYSHRHSKSIQITHPLALLGVLLIWLADSKRKQRAQSEPQKDRE